MPFSPQLGRAVVVKQDSFINQLQKTSEMQSVGTGYDTNHHFWTKLESS